MVPWRRFALVSLVGLGVALYFWTQSRYPDLNNKAVMAQSGVVADTIAARPVLSVKADAAFAKRVAVTTVNWAHDNRRGMAFGVFFAAILLTLASYLPPPKRQNRLLNALYGFFIGAPLGVCVNCAAPIFKGLLRSERVETAFAAMLSSPTMNVVVLTMVFSLFPLYMGLIKLIFALITMFIGIPVLSRLLGRNHTIADLATKRLGEHLLTPQAPTWTATQEPILVALWQALTDLGRNLWFVASRTVPLMLVAGFLGALLSHAVPTEWLADQNGPLAVAIAAVVGVLLPVPMAFDVMLTNALYTHGASPAVAVTLLCTLGIYSIYSFFITWQSASKGWAFGLMGFLTVAAMGVGLMAPALHDVFYLRPNIAAYRLLARGTDSTPSAIDLVSEAKLPELPPAKPPIVFTAAEKNGIHYFSAPFQPKSRRPGSKPFVKLEGHEIGLTRGYRYGIRDYPDPFWIGRGTAAGDFDLDGWVDLAFGTDHGVAIYKNRGGWFERVRLNPSAIDQLQVYGVAFVDMNNDGWPDLFLTTFGAGNYLILNQHGRFDPAQAIKVPNHDAVITVSPGFADLDGDGFLDVLNGNMALGIITGFHSYPPRRATTITFNHNLNFTERLPMPNLGDMGETMSTLIADLSGKGRLDLLLGHDFVFPDTLLRGVGKGEFRPDRSALPATPVFTMGLDSGDFNNDLIPDLLMTGTIERRPWVGTLPLDGESPETYAKQTFGLNACNDIKDEVVRSNCRILRRSDHLEILHQHRNLDAATCGQLATLEEREDCLLAAMWLLVTSEDRHWDCQAGFAIDRRLGAICRMLAARGERRSPANFVGELPQSDGNYVFLGQGDGSFIDINRTAAGPKAFDHPGGWTWGARIADLDNDGWQDVFTAEGAVRANDYGFNSFMKNVDGTRFEFKSFSYGLTDAFNLFSFSLIDFDFDGSLDIIGNSSVGPVQVYVNQSTGDHHSVAISLTDHLGPRQGIGARIVIDYQDASGKAAHQLREIKASGSYLSQDAPVAYFGLGTVNSVERVVIRWADGGETILEGPLAADHAYRIMRPESPTGTGGLHAP